MDKMQIVRRGDIYFADLGYGIGSEQSGTRPVLIVQNDIGNRHSPTVIVAPITSQSKANHMPTHVWLGAQYGLRATSLVLTEQLRTLDKQRLQNYVGHLDAESSQKVDEALRVSIAVDCPPKVPLPEMLRLCPDCANRFFLSSSHTIHQTAAPTDHAVECGNCHASFGAFPGYRVEVRRKRLGDG